MRGVSGRAAAMALVLLSVRPAAAEPVLPGEGPGGLAVPGFLPGRPEAPAYDFGWRPPYPYPYPYPVPYPYPPYYGDVYVLPPVWLPAESLYGPQAVRRFLGADDPRAARPNVNVIVPGGGAAGPEREKEPNLRGTGRESLDLAWRFIGFGDAHFENQKYADANQRYRKATDVAPQLADGFFRQGYALLALGRYDAAAKAFKRGLGLDAGWPKSNFRNDDLYGPNQAAKTAHLDALADAAAKQPKDGDLLFLVGLFLHFDGQQARARPFLQKAIQLAAGDDAHLRAFP